MSSNHNHTNSIINLGNYEEFFILYMDNELDQGQKEMVDAFLQQHPDLKAELEILLSTKLPVDNISFDKEELYSSSMKMNAAEEDLLLYLDGELQGLEKQKLEDLIRTDLDVQAQHNILQLTRLDPSENIPYPNKSELYRRETKLVSIKVWMRVAAAVVFIAAMGILYFMSGDQQQSSTDNVTASTPPAKERKTEIKQNIVEPVKEPVDIAINKKEKTSPVILPAENKIEDQAPIQLNEASVISQNNQIAYFERNTQPVSISEETINNRTVTSSLPERTTYIPYTSELVPNDVAVNEKNQKTKTGSVKGFMRKATRLIEKRTGIDPTNDKEEILIGVMAIKLN